MRQRRLASVFAAIALLALPARALETDQFYAWARPLNDATDAINEKINAEIGSVLTRINARHAGASCRCGTVRSALRHHLNYAIVARPELWAMKTSLIDRVPATAGEDERYRREWLYGAGSSFDRVRWMPPSPTIEAGGVRFGADKLGHFFDDGGWIEAVYRQALKMGVTDDVALHRALSLSIGTERTIWGRSSSGILSMGDLEANYQGMVFYRGLCGGPDPVLVRTSEGWRLAHPFDLREWAVPEWDESWQPNIYAKSRWAKVKPVMARHCAELHDPQVRRTRADYAARDRTTPTERALMELAASGAIEDPAQFTIEAVCATAPERLMFKTTRRGSDR